MAITTIKRSLIAAMRATGLLSLIEVLDRWPPDTVKVLAYHRVDYPRRREYLDPALISATPPEFAAQMRFLATHYRVISPERLLSSIRGRETLPPRAVLLTFDDGYRDFGENAWPVLKELGLPVLLFVSTAYPCDETRTFWWDALHQAFTQTEVDATYVEGIGLLSLYDENSRREAFSRVKRMMVTLPADERDLLIARLQRCLGVEPHKGDALLSWTEIKSLADEGVYVAPHTHTHPILGVESRARVAFEVRKSRQLVREHIGHEWPVFCYPNGQPGTFNAGTRAVLREEGYVAAFTMVWGSNSLGNADPLTMRRIGVGSHLSTSHLRLQMSGHYERLKQRRRAARAAKEQAARLLDARAI